MWFQWSWQKMVASSTMTCLTGSVKWRWVNFIIFIIFFLLFFDTHHFFFFLFTLWEERSCDFSDLDKKIFGFDSYFFFRIGSHVKVNSSGNIIRCYGNVNIKINKEYKGWNHTRPWTNEMGNFCSFFLLLFFEFRERN